MNKDIFKAGVANINMKKDEIFSRRDFLKLGLTTILAVAGQRVLTACDDLDIQDPTITQASEITPVPTLTEQNVLSGTGEFTNGDASLPTSLKELLSKSFNIEIPIEAATPFSVEIGGTKFDFVSLAPLENKELNISWDEKLFIRVDNTLADLDRKVVNIDNKNLVLWSYLNTGTPEPVLWYPSLTNDEWQNMTPEQKKDFYAGFAPPSPLESKIPGFIRSSNKMFAISFAGLPDGAQKVLASLAQPLEATTTVVESPLPQGPISELQKTLGENYKLTKAKEGDYFVINGIENLKFNADGTAEFVFEDRDLTVNFRTISVKDEALRIQGLQYKEGEWSRIIAGASSPDMSEAELAEYVDNLPKQILVLNVDGSISEWSNRLIDQIVMEKTATYDPLDEFKGIIVDGKEVGIADIVPELWQVFDYDNHDFLEIVAVGGGYANATQIALGNGWSSLVVYDTSGNTIHNLIHVPMVNLNPDSSITVTNALLNQSRLQELMGLLSTRGQERLVESTIIKSDNGTIGSSVSLSNEELRIFIYNYNKMFFDSQQNSFEELLFQFPLDLSTNIYFDLYHTEN